MLSSNKIPIPTADVGTRRQLLLSCNKKESHHHQYDAETKYRMLKRKLRAMIELNESISRDYIKAKKKVRLLTLERDILLHNITRIGKIQQLSPVEDHAGLHLLDERGSDSDDDAISAVSSSSSNGSSSSSSRSSASTGSSSNNSNSSDNNNVAHTLTQFTGPQRRTRRPRPAQRLSQHTYLGRSGGAALQKRQHKDMTTVSSAPPKRSKMNPLASLKTRRVQPVDRDATGMVKLPQQIGVLTVMSLGKIVYDRDTFHNERYIFPVGFAVRRTYPSMTDPTKNTVIVSTILDGGDGPLFQVVAEDMPDEPIIANSATGAWTVVVRRSNEIRRREHSNSASGPDYYGFKHPTIAKLIQDLPDTEKLKYYIRQDFEEMEPRAAKGVMAAALKKRGNLEQMGNANVRAPKNASSALTTVARRDEEEPPPALVHPALFNNILLDADDCQQ